MRDYLKAPLSNLTGLILSLLVIAALLFSGAGAGALSPLALGGSGVTNFDSVTLSNDLTVGDDAAITGDLAVTGAVTLATGDVTAGEIADITRAVNIPLNGFIECQTDAGALIGFDTTADALPDFVNSATDGTGFVIRFDDTGSSEDQGSEVCSQVMVPPDYASGGAFRVRALKDAHTAAAELLTMGVSVNGAALQAAGTVTTTASATTVYTVTPTISALAVNDSLAFYLSITSDSTMNDVVDIAAIEFIYTATQ